MKSIEEISAKTIPDLQRIPVQIGDYGMFQTQAGREDKIDALLGISPSAGLSRTIRDVVNCLVQTDPKVFDKKPSFKVSSADRTCTTT